jgi:hypothetical protein
MAKIVDEPKILRYEFDPQGKKIPVYSAKVETTVTDTKEEDIRRDVHVIAPNLFSGAYTGDE